jgi:hypothetical protein
MSQQSNCAMRRPLQQALAGQFPLRPNLRVLLFRQPGSCRSSSGQSIGNAVGLRATREPVQQERIQRPTRHSVASQMGAPNPSGFPPGLISGIMGLFRRFPKAVTLFQPPPNLDGSL